MLTLSIEALTQQVNQLFWPALRVLAIFTTAPVFNESEIPKKVKIGLALLITFLISPGLPEIELAIVSLSGLLVMGQQLLIGAAMGLMMQLIFVTVRTAGEIIGLQIGLSFATFFDPSGGTNMPVIARILNLLAMLLLLSLNGHLWFLSVLSDSFVALPVGTQGLNSGAFYYLAHSAGVVFRSGLMLALPIVTLLLAINFSLGLLNRLTPQLSIFVVGFPLTLTVGMWALMAGMSTLGPFFERLLMTMFEHLGQLLVLLGAD
ncbi:flagellar biosynthetic protein FliR [Entomohabitans teleogrylli]|uniref:flagellar biosynthetic protein FliR n=1 Tax=Entomohabitans teleogrylli TaxID=1384589 RepID=UPI00073DAA9A|nr:flagellar biosynthetic protein FliR [Entomohabitans teleogrylli]